MKLYRVTGRAEAFKGCGMLRVKDEYFLSQKLANTYFLAAARGYRKASCKHSLALQRIDIEPLTLTTIVDCLNQGDMFNLITVAEVIRKVEWSPPPETPVEKTSDKEKSSIR